MVMLLKETPPPEGCTTHAQGELISQADGRHINTHIGIYTHRHTHLHNTVALRSSITCKVRCSHREMTGTLAHTHRHTHTHLHNTVALRLRITCRVRCSHREMTGTWTHIHTPAYHIGFEVAHHVQGRMLPQGDDRHIDTHTHTHTHTHIHIHTHLHNTVALRSRITCRVRCSHREMTGKASKYSLASTRMEAIPSKPERKSVTLHLRSAGSTGRCHT